MLTRLHSGMEPLIRAVLSNLIGEEDASHIDIVSNSVKVEADGKWEIQYRHPSRYVALSGLSLPCEMCIPTTAAAASGTTSHKPSSHTAISRTRLRFSSSATVSPVCLSSPSSTQTDTKPSYLHETFFSDLSAARHADILFVKEKADGENDLATYCTTHGIAHILFPDFAKALAVVQSVVNSERTPAEALALKSIV